MLVKPVWLLFMVAAAPRVLGVDGYGVMQSGLALAGLALAFSDLGVSSHALREVVRDPSVGERVLANTLAVRGVALAVCSVAGLAAALALGYSGPALWTVGGALAYLVAHHLTGYGRVFIRSSEDLRPEALSTVAEKGVVVAAGAAGLLVVGTPAATVWAMAGAMVAVAAVQMAWVARTLVPLRWASLDLPFARQVVWLALPLGAADILLAVYFRTDQVMVEAMLGAGPAGQYGQAFRILEALSLLPAVVVQGALFPRLARLAASGTGPSFFRQIVVWGGGLTLAATGIAAALSIGAEPLVVALTGDPAFAPASAALSVLAWTFPLTCIKDTLFVALLARHRHRFAIATFALAVALNVGLNLWSIPAFGIAGASAVTLATEAAVVVAYFVYEAVLYRRGSTLDPSPS